jgi:CheY-like chemotaxis protein
VALQEAEAARARAEAANQAKSAFLATLSHEIRTPLNGVIGLSELAREDGVDEAARREYLHQLGESAKLLNTIISDVLDLSKIESGRMEVERVPFELREVLQILHGSYRTLGRAKGVEVRLELPPGVPATVVGDPTRVQQVLNNFLSNALKFTARGHITLRAQLERDALRFEVQDTGIGVAAAQVEHLFQPFTQADVSDTRRYGGTGLGLAICRELARLMGGSVGAHGEPGVGSTFWLRLPLPEGEAEPTKTANDTKAEKAATPTENSMGLDGLHLLLAEDNRVNAVVATRLLERAGARVQWVESGAAALAAVQARWEEADGTPPFDAVLMDVHMPDMDGLEATRRLRALEAEHPGRSSGRGRLPIIAMTAGVLTEQQQAARDAGMDGFIPKPLDRRTLMSELAGLRRAPRGPG